MVYAITLRDDTIKQMGKRGPKPKGKVNIQWSADFAYGIGLLVSDGNLSPNGRHIVFTSKDLEMIELFQQSLKIEATVGRKSSGRGLEKRYHVAQFGDVLFYQFLLDIGLMPNKSKYRKNSFLIFFEVRLMEMAVHTLILILVGNQASCFIPSSFLPA